MSIEAMKQALEALEYEPIGKTSGKKDLKDQAIAAIKEALAQPEQEPVAWPCVIAEADFSENTVTLAMQCTDYKVSAGKHWLSTNPPQRTWVRLTDDEIDQGLLRSDYAFKTAEAWRAGVVFAMTKLKQKNGYDS